MENRYNVDEQLFKALTQMPRVMRGKIRINFKDQAAGNQMPGGPVPIGPGGPKCPGKLGPGGHGPMVRTLPMRPEGPGCPGKPGPGGPFPGKNHAAGILARERILLILAGHEGGVRQKVLAEEMKVNPSSMSEFIDRLESTGYITRTVDLSDKRATLITLTEKGEARAAELEDEKNEHLSKMFSNLTEDEKKELIRLLNKLFGKEEVPADVNAEAPIGLTEV